MREVRAASSLSECAGASASACSTNSWAPLTPSRRSAARARDAEGLHDPADGIERGREISRVFARASRSGAANRIGGHA